MDHQFTKLIGEWLSTPDNERDYTIGNLYLLKLSGNQIQFRNIALNPAKYAKVIEYKLQKYYNFRVVGLTHDEVEEMQKDVDRIVAQHQLSAESRELNESNQSSLDSGHSSLDKNHRGKRDDHDLLPDEIKALYVENLSILQQMRELHLKLRSLSLENVSCPDSERYPFLKELIKLDKKMHSNWEQYDHFIIPTNETNSKPKRNSKTAKRKA